MSNLSLPLLLSTNLRETVLPLDRLNSVTSMCVPPVSPSVAATAPAAGATDAVVAVGCGAGAVVVAAVAVDGAGGAVSVFLQANTVTRAATIRMFFRMTSSGGESYLLRSPA